MTQNQGLTERKERLKIKKILSMKTQMMKKIWKILNLTGILKLCLLKQLVDKQLDEIKSKIIKEVIIKLKNEIKF